MVRGISGDRGARSLLTREVDAHPAAFSSLHLLRLRQVPMLLLAVCFACGILCRGWWSTPSEIVLACTLLLATSLAAWQFAPRMVWLACAASWFALGWAAILLQPVPQSTTLLPYADGLQRNIEARVLSVRDLPDRTAAQNAEDQGADTSYAESAPDNSERQRRATQVVELAITRMEEVTPDISRMVPVSGGARITLTSRGNPSPPRVSCGGDIQLTVRLWPPQRYLDPGVWQYADALAERGIGVTGNADIDRSFVQGQRPHTWPCLPEQARQWASARMQQLPQNPIMKRLPPIARLTPQDTAMLRAMFFGDRTALDEGLRSSFEKTGTFHLFVVAGMHVALVLAFLFEVFLRFRMPRTVAALLALGITTAYALTTGFGEPVQRALGMCAVYLFARLLGRGRSPLNALGASALAMLVLRPNALFEAGFQMTVLSIFAIAGIAIPLCERTIVPYIAATRDHAFIRNDTFHKPLLAQFRVSMRWFAETLFPRRSSAQGKRPLFRRGLAQIPARLTRFALQALELLIITLVAEAVLALPMAIYFHRATPLAAPVNILALPLVGMLMLAGIATFTASLLSPWIALIPAAATALLLHGITGIVGTLSSLRGADVRIPAPWIAFSLLAFVLWCAALWLLHKPSRRMGYLACCFVPIGLLLVLWPRTPSLQHNRLEFTAIDVGQGDSLFVVSPQGQTMLIDAGGPTGSAEQAEQITFDIGEQVVSPYLWSRGLRRLDVLVLTHAHSDHIGGMAAVMRNFKPRELWLSVDPGTPLLQALLQEAAAQHITVRHMHAGETVAWAGTDIRVLNPALPYVPRGTPTNDDSLVLRIAYGHASVLAEGDAERASEAGIVTQVPGPVTLLKVGHHGSNTSTTDALLQAAQPREAVISSGRGNRFGHPRPPVLQRLQAAGVRTLRTDETGAIQYFLNSDGVIQSHALMQPQ